jgi:Ca2+-binding EF-hand superfamily protein
LTTDFNHLRKTFKKFDKTIKGYLNIQEFNDLLKYFKLADKLNSEDIYQIIAEFDPAMKGCFFYNEFMKTLIEKSLKPKHCSPIDSIIYALE